jgi:PKD repeat protein
MKLERLSGKRAILAVIVALILGQAGYGHAGDLLWDDEGTTFARFGPNQTVAIAQGTILFACDSFFPTADVYVVKGSPAPGAVLVDVSGTPNTVFGFSGGFFTGTIGFTGPAGNLGPGKYTVVYDECQNKTLDPVDSVFPESFEVVIPADVPPIDPLIGSLKERATNMADALQRELTVIETLSDRDELFQCLVSPPACAEAVFMSLLFDPVKAQARDVAADNINHYRAIAADPPDPFFGRSTRLARIPAIELETDDALALAKAGLGNALAAEAALAQALLQAIERYKGADIAGDGAWALVHAREIASFSRLLAQQLATSDDARRRLQVTLHEDPRDFDALAVRVGAELDRIATLGFDQSQTTVMYSLELSPPIMAWVAARASERRGVGSFTRAGFDLALADVVSAHQAAAPVLQALATQADALAEVLKANPDILDGFPSASAGGPYTAGEDAQLSLAGSAADADGRIVSADWDLDGDGQFDDATGLTPSVSFPRAFSGLISVRVVDDDGKDAIAFAEMNIADTNKAPVVSRSSPAATAPKIPLGSTETFTVEASDPEGVPLEVTWTLDGVLQFPSSGEFSTGFDTEIPAEISGAGALTGVQWFSGLGTPGNTFGGGFLRVDTTDATTLTLTGLPPHTHVDIDFLFAAIDSWDGGDSSAGFPSGDFFTVAVDGATLFHESFENSNAGFQQTYVPPPGVLLRRLVDLGFNDCRVCTDAAYDMSKEPRFHGIPHTASTLTVTFRSGGPGFQAGFDESWAIDNLRVSLGGTDGTAFNYSPAAGDVGIHILEATISDGATAVKRTWTVFAVLSDVGTVTPSPGVAPQVAAGPDVSAQAGAPVPLASASFTDDIGPHAARVNWGDGSPTEDGTVAGSASAGTVAGTHAYAEPGSYTVTVIVAGPDGLSGRDAFTVTVTPANLRPRLAPGAVSMKEGGVLTVPAFAIDPEGEPVTLSASGLPTYAVFTDLGNGLGALELVPTDDDTAQLEVKACDAGGCTSEVFTLSVVNVAPLAAASSGGPIVRGTAATVTAAQADPGADTFEYAFDCDGDGIFGAFGSSSAESCSFATVGSHVVGVQVRDDDGGIGATQTAVVVMDAKVATATVAAGAPNPSLFGELVTFTATVRPVGPEGTLPTGTVQFRDDGAPVGSPVPLVAGVANTSTSTLRSGLHAITADYSGDDIHEASTGATSQSVRIAAHAGDDARVNEGTAVVLEGSRSVGSSLSFSWHQIAGPAVALSDPISPTPAFTAPLLPGGLGGPEALGFSLTVTDPAGQSSTDTVEIGVANVNHAPLASAGPDQVAEEGAQIGLSGSGADPDSDPVVSFRWVQTGGPAVSVIGSDSATPSFAAPTVGPSGATLFFQLTVSDGPLDSTPDEVAIAVRNVNDPPSCASAQASSPVLWPPNHELIPIDVLGVADPNGQAVAVSITSVTQDEPVEDAGDGHTSPDAVLEGSRVLVRAERSGLGNGRVYQVHFRADDGQGGLCAGRVTVGVPHSRGSVPVDDGQAHDSTRH